jgi:AcrR family transcriptional regulator
VHSDLSLRERKRLRTEERIMASAFELFAERGFGEVTVEDIAARAEVGRTTFFRYFGDKSEVVFGTDDAIGSLLADIPDLRGAGLAEVLASLRHVVVALCLAFPGGRDRFPFFFALVAATPELQDRERRKLGGHVEAIEAALRERGVVPAIAALAPQLALGCFEAARRLAGPDLDRLVSEVGAAFDAAGASAAGAAQ